MNEAKERAVDFFARWPPVKSAAGLLLGWAFAVSVQAGSFVSDSGTFFSAAGDVDGDGFEDVLILDKASGACRVGHGRADGEFEFGRPVATGVPDAIGVAVGKLADADVDAIAVSGFEANRVHVVLPTGELYNELEAVVAAGPVPGGLAALDVPSSGTVGRDDLVAHSFGRGETLVLKNLAGVFGEIDAFDPGRAARDFNPVVLSAGGVQHLGFFFGDGAVRYRIGKAVGSAVVLGFDSVLLREGARAIWVRTPGAAEHEFLFFVPGESAVTVQRVAAGEGAFLEPREFDVGAGVAQMFRLPRADRDRVLVQFESGRVEVFEFDPATGFETLGVIDGGDGQPATGAVPLSDGRFVSFYGAGGVGAGAFQVFQWDGSAYVAAGAVAELPAVFADSYAANVFLFDGKPFIDEAPVLLGQQRAADWTVSVTGGGEGSTVVAGESFLDPTAGLGGSTPISIDGLSTPVDGILVNQFRSDISVASLPVRPAVLGEGIVDLRISPPGDRYDFSIEVSVTPVGAGDRVYLRRGGGGAFVEQVGSFQLVSDTQIEAYAESADGKRRSAVQTVEYTFGKLPEEQDTDGDGLPDFVEVANRLPVDGGADSDGDGTGDLEELLSGHLPWDPNDHPDLEVEPRRDTAARLALRLTPRPWNAELKAPTFARRETGVRGFSIDGGLLGVGRVQTDGGRREAQLSLEPVDQRSRVVTVATEAHFLIESAPAGAVIGRELVALVSVPEVTPIDVPFEFGSAVDLEAEAADWVEAAIVAYAGGAPEEIVREMTIEDSLVLVLVEAKLRSVMEQREAIAPGRLVSLTPQRPTEFDPARYLHVRAGDLDRLATLTQEGLDSEWDAVRIREVLADCDGWLRSAAGLPLRDLGADVYQVSGEYSNDLPAGLPLPIDALREFVQGGGYPAAYLPFSRLTGVQVAAAISARDSLLAEPVGRPVVTLDVELLEGAGLGDERTLVATGAGEMAGLVDDRGAPFELPEAFDLLPGSQLRVSGFDDLTGPGGLRVLEVISIEVVLLAQPGVGDVDGNLLGDHWELLFFGRTGMDRESSPDGSGYSLLHQFLAGTDPTDGASVPVGEPAEFDLSGTDLVIGADGPGVFLWEWPAEYVDAFEFGVMIASEPGGSDGIEEVLNIVAGDGGEEDQFAALMNPGGGEFSGRRFFRLFVRLR